MEQATAFLQEAILLLASASPAELAAEHSALRAFLLQAVEASFQDQLAPDHLAPLPEALDPFLASLHRHLAASVAAFESYGGQEACYFTPICE